MQIGRVVLATAGRDKGKTFVIIGVIDEDYVYIANGTNRTVDNPKKKKIKHLEPVDEYLGAIRDKVLKGQKVFDAEIRKSLEALENE